MRIIRLIIAFACLQVGSTVAASIEEQINNFINEVEIPRLSSIYPDAAIKIIPNNLTALNYLPECKSKTIQIENQRPESTKRTNYVISCRDPIWKSFTPITQSISVIAIKTSSPINRGQTINKSNTSLGEVDLNSIRGHIFTQKNPPYGLIASRNLRINTFITHDYTNQPTLIKKGDRVTITARSGNIIVKMNGLALESGKKDQQIRVKNTSSGRIIYANVVTDSEVLVNY